MTGSIIGKQFQNKSNGEIIKVISIDGNIAVLENEQRISVERLLDNNHYINSNRIVTESNETTPVNINMNNDGGLHNHLLSQIKGLSSDAINRADDNGTISINGDISSTVESHYGSQGNLNIYDNSEVQAMLDKAKRDQLELDREIKNQTDKVLKSAKMEDSDNEISPIVNRNLEGAISDSTRKTSVNVIEDVGYNTPTKKAVNPMFIKMKRTQKVSLQIDITEMLPNKDLLKMLEEGFEDSVLDYLTDEIANKVLTDKLIKSQIKDKLHSYVYASKKRNTTKLKVTK